MSYKNVLLAFVLIMAIFQSTVFAESLLAEAKRFDSHDGWESPDRFQVILDGVLVRTSSG